MLRRHLFVLFSVVLGVGILCGVLIYLGWNSSSSLWARFLAGMGIVVSQITMLGWWGFFSLAGIVLATMLLWSLSWWTILRAYGVHVSWWATWRARVCGFAITYLTPSMYLGGEPASIYLIAQEQQGEKAPATRIVATILVAKLLEGLCLLAFIYLGVYYALATKLLPLDDTGAIVTGMVLFGVFLALLLMNLAGHRLWGTRVLGWLRDRLPWKRALEVAESKVREVEEDVFIAFREHGRATLVAFIFNLCATFLVFMRPQVFFLFALRAFFPVSHLAMIYTLFIFLGAFFWITPGGTGVFEVGSWGIFSLFPLISLVTRTPIAVPQESAIAFALALKTIEFPLVGLGLFYLIRVGFLKIPKPPLPH
ncbi:MAG: flippase-like domain-containing protein [Candidatus Bipolaricaulota bacterium]|nr:flippase-like domain-containing protein [Candidatus Bipolaricaulota bacterium]